MAAAVTTSSAASSSGSSVYDVSEEKTNGTRLARLLVDGGTHVLRTFLHSIHPSATLQDVLNNNSAKLQRLKVRRVIFDEQWVKLFPATGDPPDSETFDITLLHLLLREICHLTMPSTGWHNMPADSDASPEANIIRIKCFRNELCHSVSTGIPNGEFEDKWNKISSSLEALEVNVYRQRIQGLKNDPIDHDTRRVVAEQLEQWRKVQQQDECEVNSELCSCLPDKIPEELMFGRTQEIKHVKDIVQSGAVPVTLITGGPGFGKTTVANVVAHELAKPENERTVLFCSLLSKRTFNEVATEMIYSCGTIHAQPPENPEQWLKDWSKQIQVQVTFVLDNADGVLESGDRSSFLNTLRVVRMLSKQNVTFVITTRKTFKDPDLQATEVRLNPLSPSDAKNILVSRVHEHEIRKKLSKTEEIVQLCGCVPLALCIVGSLLSDYTEEKLIKHLEEEPLTVLEDDQASVENAIKTSFDLLTKAEQEAFVLMSVFPGPFDSDAVEAVMEACSVPGTLPVSILRSLKNRSLVEQPSSRRYQLHPLIHAFASKIGRAEYSHLLDEGKKLACGRFMSRLAENANMYWSKDTCKKSVASFNEDRQNFEYFLQVYAQRMESKNQAIWLNTCKTFLDDFPQKCMYLEKCVLPKFYIVFLELLLKSFDSEMHPVYVVDVLCLLGHESRKEGDKRKYKELMEKAEQIHSKKSAEFETKALSEVYFRNSYARFLSDKKDPNENKRMEHETETALKVCNEYLGDHPETAATLLFAGIQAKRRKERSEAEQKFTEAFELSKKLLGKHFMTAESLKAIADHYFFFDGKTEADLDKCLVHYGDAMEVFEDLGMGDSKESVLTRKNFGMCHTRKGNFSKALNLLTKAERVAEQELEVDHPWKVSIKTELAILHEKMRNPDQAKDIMLEGLLMGKRLDLTIDKMGGKDRIREFINRYPETFPETEFPRNVRANTVPQADKTRHKGPKHFKPRIDAEAWARGSSGRTGRVGAAAGISAATAAAAGAGPSDSRPSENRFSVLAEERNVSAPGRRQNFGDFGRSRQERQEPHKPMSGYGSRGPFQSSEQEKVLETIPAETLTKNIEFGLEQADSSSQITGSSSQHFARIQDELRTLILKKKARNKDVLKWIDKNVSAADTKEASFIRALVTIVCEDTMDREQEDGHCKCNIGRLKDRKKLLQRYIDDNINLELQALYAVQVLFVQLDYPPGFIKSYFDSFYDEEILTEEAFNAWESSSEEKRGKNEAVAASSQFFRWVRSASEEPGEED